MAVPGAVTHTPASGVSAHVDVDVSAHEKARVSCRPPLKLVPISSLVIINFPLMPRRRQRRR